MIRIIESEDERRLIINEKDIEIMDADDDFALATCDLDDLDEVSSGSVPAKLLLEVHNNDCFGTRLFYQVIIFADDEVTALDFRCLILNKYWEGFYGLGTFIDEIHEQARNSNIFEVVDIKTEGDYKGITLRRHVPSEKLLLAAISETASELKVLEEAAEVALAKRAVKLFKKKN